MEEKMKAVKTEKIITGAHLYNLYSNDNFLGTLSRVAKRTGGYCWQLTFAADKKGFTIANTLKEAFNKLNIY